MIFVTVGTHEQPFNRLIQFMDEMKEKGEIQENVIIQTGFSTYKPKSSTWKKLYSYQDMLKNVTNARIIVTHGGPSSFIMPLQIGKVPIVVPRKKEFDEHINNHQVRFCRAVEKRQGSIIVAEDMSDLKNIIIQYDDRVKSMNSKMKSNNKTFNEELEKIIHNMFENG